MTTKDKIAKCFELSLQLKGVTFHHASNSEIVSVYRITDGVQEWTMVAYYGWNSPDSLDNLIESLTAQITKDQTFINAEIKGDTVVFYSGENGEFERIVEISDLHQFITDNHYNSVQISEDDLSYYPANECLVKNFDSITKEYFEEVLSHE